MLRCESGACPASRARSFDLGGRAEAVIRRRRREGPFETGRMGPFPTPGSRLLAAARALDNHDGEQDLRQPEAEPADGRHHIPVAELHRVVRYAPRHAREAKEMLREEQDVDEDRREPEM